MNNVLKGILLFATSMVFVPSANAFVIGTASFGNCYPFGCSYWEPNYQQVYGSSEFSGAMTIESLSFYRTVDTASGNTPVDSTFTISLSTTAKNVDGLSSTASDNLGVDNTVVFNGLLPSSVALGERLDFNFSNTFAYDPSMGNLLLDVKIDGAGSNSSIYFDAYNISGDSVSRLYGNGGLDSSGLVTGFNELVANVPAPSSILLLIIGLAGIRFSQKKVTV